MASDGASNSEDALNVKDQTMFSQAASSSSTSTAERDPSDEAIATETVLELKYKWSGVLYEISIAVTDTVGDLKALVYSQTTVPPERQKILGLTKGKLLSDEAAINELQLLERGRKEFTVLGTPLGKEFQMKLLAGPSDTVDEQDVEPAQAMCMDDANMRKRNARKLKEACDKLQLNVMNEPRPGKKLLVLDLDYTILAWQSQSFHAIDYQRPGLHQFLEDVYPYYDIVIWSQTSWMWLESKLVELGMLGDDTRGYRISFVLDRRPMFSVYSVRRGKPFKHEVKALQIIWNKFPRQYNKDNSVHIDDLGRNFVLNPQQGLKISAYRDASSNRHTDQELPALARYLVSIGDLPSLSHLDHNKWKEHTSN